MPVEFKSNLQAIQGMSQEAISNALEIIGGMAESYAKQLCPVDTGRLRNSITHQQEDENTVAIGTNVVYAPFVELGTRRMAAQPYLRPAIEEHKTDYQRVIEGEFRRLGK
jgi:HK97 gp10 family phage protein